MTLRHKTRLHADLLLATQLIERRDEPFVALLQAASSAYPASGHRARWPEKSYETLNSKVVPGKLSADTSRKISEKITNSSLSNFEVSKRTSSG